MKLDKDNSVKYLVIPIVCECGHTYYSILLKDNTSLYCPRCKTWAKFKELRRIHAR